MVTAIGIGCGLFVGYMCGWMRGYEGKEKDLNKLEKEMNEFWKEVGKRVR